jgi:hypothetical protein
MTVGAENNDVSLNVTLLGNQAMPVVRILRVIEPVAAGTEGVRKSLPERTTRSAVKTIGAMPFAEATVVLRAVLVHFSQSL